MSEFKYTCSNALKCMYYNCIATFYLGVISVFSYVLVLYISSVCWMNFCVRYRCKINYCVGVRYFQHWFKLARKNSLSCFSLNFPSIKVMICESQNVLFFMTSSYMIYFYHLQVPLWCCVHGSW